MGRAFYLNFIIWLTFLATTPAFGEVPAQDLFSPELFTADTQPTATPLSPRPSSRIAENITVITAEQIAALHVHTLTELLNTIPGVSFDNIRTPGGFSYIQIQGASVRNIQLFIDGISQNDLLESFAVTNNIPVQNIERVEIVKGAASATWGSGLGGIINVVTKVPPSDKKPLSGEALSSFGERGTNDLHGEVTGALQRFGYYLSGGTLHSRGLLPNNGTNQNDAYLKLTYALPSGGDITYGMSFLDTHRGLYDVPPPFDYHDSTSTRQFYTFLNYEQNLAERLNLKISLHHLDRDSESIQGYSTIPDLYQYISTSNKLTGGKAELDWGTKLNNLRLGTEYEKAEASIKEPIRAQSFNNFVRDYDRWAAFANSTLSFGRLSILPGIRYDHTGVQDNNWSYLLGATWQLSAKSLLRTYAAKGFSLPLGYFDNPSQKTDTVQAGFETGDIPYLWLKGTFFYNRLNDIVSYIAADGSVTDQVRQGVELEAKTVPVYGLSLGGGYTFADTYEKLNHSKVPEQARHVAKISLDYKHERSGLSGLLTGHYVNFQKLPDNTTVDDRIIWDIVLSKKFTLDKVSPEIFFKVNNIFNDSQYLAERYRNAGRWIEGGVRFQF